MDYSEATEEVFKRIKELNPPNVAKLLGHILLQNQGVPEMLRLANAPTHVLKSLIEEHSPSLEPARNSNHYSYTDKGKKPLVVSQPPIKFTPFVPSSFPTKPITPNMQHFPLASSNSQLLEHNQPHELAKQVCNDFSRGYCRQGGNCKLLHLRRMENGCFMVLNPKNKDDTITPDHASQPGSLKHLEMELVELLRGRRGIPVSISSIPILYYDKYAMSLLLEHRNKEGFICTMKKLLSQMEKTILVINRPHGRPSIVLVEDFKNIKKRNDGGHGLVLRVYMTFRPESVFTEQDVYNYFENFGPVEEVKIPCHIKRMYGFVTFVYAETAALVLSKTNPHYISGWQVMMKPYRLKPLMLVDRNV